MQPLVKAASLPNALLQVIQHKGTERPFSGDFIDPQPIGTYLCRQCGLSLFRAHDQFYSGCGWPSFDNEIADHVARVLDADGFRTEIVCSRCHAHLGHVFTGEEQTPRNMRHCVNSLSLDYVADNTVLDTSEAILAAGCFWGVEYYLKRLPGVLKTEVGYSGGALANPSYEAVCRKDTGHVEVIRVVFDSAVLSYENLLKFFFEIHDPTQTSGQGPDLGPQYASVIFYYDTEQQKIAQGVVALLAEKGYAVATQLHPVTIFWPAEKYHQDYYQKIVGEPYCHRYVKRF